MKIIKNAHIFTACGKEYEKGVVVYDKKIEYVGEDYTPDGNDEIIDMEGMFVMPGLCDAHSHIGLFGDSVGFESADANEDSDPVTPHLRAIDGINPQDRAFSDAVSAGVTTVVTGPGSANPIGGQFAAVKTHGVCVDDMVIKSPCAMKMSLGENPKTVYNDKNQAPLTRMGTAAIIRETLQKAKNYCEDNEKYKNDPENCDKPEYDIKLEAMMPVIERKIPVKFHAHRADDICTAIRIAKEFSIDYTIEHCSDGDIIADILKREGTGVNLGPTLTDRSKPELKNLSFKTYKNLSDRGIKISIITDHPEITQDNLPLCAAMVSSYGMDKNEVLCAITKNAAENCGIADRVGSLKKGMDADIAVFTAPPSEFGAKCVMTVIDGKTVYKA